MKNDRKMVRINSTLTRLMFVAAVLLISAGPANAYKQKTEMITMRDGIKLATEIYYPASWKEGSNKQYPVLLMRTPYGRKAWGDMLAPFVLPKNFILVSQDTRGRFDSEGFSTSFMDDATDGYEAVEWIAAQPWCKKGRVGTVGISAMGITQFMMDKIGPPHLACQLIMAATPDLYDTAYQGGGFRRALVLGWLGGNKFPVEVIKLIMSNVDKIGLWDATDMTEEFEKVNVPILHMAGWYDMFLGNNLEGYEGIQKHGGPKARGKQRLVIGPWTHQGFLGLAGGPTQGDLTYPQNAVYDVPKMVGWFNKCMAGEELSDGPAVKYYVMGDVDDKNAPGNEWRFSRNWPVPAKVTPYYFQKDGTLSPKRQISKNDTAAFIDDPANPTPTIGGANLILKRGPRDQRPIESRDDVLVYSTPPLKDAIEVTGPIKAKIYISADVVDADYTVRLTDVYPDGRSMLLTDGIIRVSHRESQKYRKPMIPGKIYELTVDMWATSIVFNKRHRIRIIVAGSNFPRFDVNMHNGRYFDLQPGELEAAMLDLDKYYSTPDLAPDTKIAHNTLYLSKDHPSSILLPIVKTYTKKAKTK